MRKLMIAALGAATMAVAMPAAAQELPVKSGDFWDVTSVKIDDGHFADYADFLANDFRKQSEFAKSKGWIKGYYILSNVNPRGDEPDLYLVADLRPRADTGGRRAAREGDERVRAADRPARAWPAAPTVRPSAILPATCCSSSSSGATDRLGSVAALRGAPPFAMNGRCAPPISRSASASRAPNGRMGRAIAAAVSEDSGFALAQDQGDVLVDFSAPAALQASLDRAISAGVPDPHRHHRPRRARRPADRGGCRAGRGAPRRQHLARRRAACRARRARRARARARLGHRDRRDPSPAEGGCAVGHRAACSPPRQRVAAGRQRSRSEAATAPVSRARPAPSASHRSAAGRSQATMT